MTITPRFALPLLSAGQAQKEMTHNEALVLIDALVQPSVQAVGIDSPPVDAAPGQCWIVGNAPEDAWSGKAKNLAIWTGGGWRFVAARDGMSIVIGAGGLTARFTDGIWQTGHVHATEVIVSGQRVVAQRQPAIGDANGGGVVDVEVRTAMHSVLETLRAHGLIAT